MQEEAKKKMEATPTVVGDVENPKVLGVAEVKTVLIQYTDPDSPYGEPTTRLAFLLGDEIRFLENKALTRPVTSWIRNGVHEFMKKAEKK